MIRYRELGRSSRGGARLVAVAATLAMVATACGGGEQDGDTAAPEETETTEAETPDGTEEATEVAAGGECEDYPSRPIESIVPYSAGGGTDQVGRLWAQIASTYSDVPIRHVVMPGAGAALGSKFVADAEPDGYTMTFGTSASLVSVGMLEDVGYTHEAFEPVATVTAPSFVFVVPPDSPFKTWTELLEFSKENPGEITYGVSGSGGSPGILVAGLEEELGFEWTMVPFDGSSAAVLAAAAGDVDLAVPSLGSALDQIEAGIIRPLVQTAPERSVALPDTPTFIDEGTDFEFTIWRAIGVPAGTPDCVIDHLAGLAKQVHDNEEWQELAGNIEGEPPIFLGPAESETLWEEYEAFLEPIVDELRPE